MASLRYNKAKGRTWESDVVEFMIANGAPNAERRRLHGAADKGDTTGIPGVVNECKNEKTYKLPGWLAELRVEMKNAGVDVGAVWARANGKPGAENGFIIMTPEIYMTLLKRAGYLPEEREDVA